MAADCIQESCIYERCLTPEDSAAAIGNSIPLRSTPFPIAEPYSKFSVFFDYTFLDNSKDDENISKMISITLSMEGHSFDVCYDGLTAEKMIGQKAYDVILLDIMLPGQSGFELLSKIKPENGAVIFLTALQDVSDKVKGLKLGAEDYIVKPFEPIELLARIEVVLRRQNKAGTVFRYGDIEADESRHTVTKGGQPVTLTPKEFELLLFFLRHKGMALTREKILYGVWGYQFMGETRTVDAHVQQIRKKLSLQNSIVTIPKVGYRLEAGDLK